jgi:hypothetical protein
MAAPEFAPRIIDLHRKVVEHLTQELWRNSPRLRTRFNKFEKERAASVAEMRDSIE